MCCLLVLAAGVASGQTASNFYGGAHGESLAHTNSTLTGVAGIYGNIAGLAYVQDVGVDVSYDSRFGLSELSTASVAAAYKVSGGTFGLLASKYGFDDYSENKVGFAYGRKLSKKLSLGGMLDLLQYNVGDLGTTNKITFELGMYAELTDDIHLGVTIFSPGTVSLTDVQTLPSRLSIGLRYMVSPKTTLILDATKIAERPLEGRLAIDYQLQESVGLRFGANVTQSTIHFGAFANITDDIRVLAAYSYNNQLGNTPSISLTYKGMAPSRTASRRRQR